VFLPSDHRGHARRFLLDLEWGGQSYHLSTDDTSYIDDDGEETRYTGALELDEVPLDVGVRNADAPALTVPAVLHLDGIADVPLLIAQGHDLGAALCKLWVWLQDTSKRVLLLDGQVLDPLWGAAHEPVTLSLLDTRRENALRFPPLDARVSPDTWPTIYGGSVQQFYPWVIGKPGDNTTGAWGSPALVVETVLQVAVGNRHIDFDEGSGEVTASLTVASYSPSDLAAQIVTKMDAAGVDSYTATIEAGTGLWTIASATGGTFSLLWSTGTNSANTAGTLLGADTTRTRRPLPRTLSPGAQTAQQNASCLPAILSTRLLRCSSMRRMTARNRLRCRPSTTVQAGRLQSSTLTPARLSARQSAVVISRG